MPITYLQWTDQEVRDALAPAGLFPEGDGPWNEEQLRGIVILERTRADLLEAMLNRDLGIETPAPIAAPEPFIIQAQPDPVIVEVTPPAQEAIFISPSWEQIAERLTTDAGWPVVPEAQWVPLTSLPVDSTFQQPNQKEISCQRDFIKRMCGMAVPGVKPEETLSSIYRFFGHFTGIWPNKSPDPSVGLLAFLEDSPLWDTFFELAYYYLTHRYPGVNWAEMPDPRHLTPNPIPSRHKSGAMVAITDGGSLWPITADTVAKFSADQAQKMAGIKEQPVSQPAADPQATKDPSPQETEDLLASLGLPPETPENTEAVKEEPVATEPTPELTIHAVEGDVWLYPQGAQANNQKIAVVLHVNQEEVTLGIITLREMSPGSVLAVQKSSSSIPLSELGNLSQTDLSVTAPPYDPQGVVKTLCGLSTQAKSKTVLGWLREQKIEAAY